MPTPNNWSMILATTPTGVIGDASGLLWNIPEDMKHFREMTTNNIVIMGRKTYETIGRPLPNRINIILSSSPVNGNSCRTQPELLYTNLDTLDEVVSGILSHYPDKHVFVIGGKQIYEQLLNRVDSIYITTVYLDIENTEYIALSPEFMKSIETDYVPDDIYIHKQQSISGVQYSIHLYRSRLNFI